MCVRTETEKKKKQAFDMYRPSCHSGPISVCRDPHRIVRGRTYLRNIPPNEETGP